MHILKLKPSKQEGAACQPLGDVNKSGTDGLSECSVLPRVLSPTLSWGQWGDWNFSPVKQAEFHNPAYLSETLKRLSSVLHVTINGSNPLEGVRSPLCFSWPQNYYCFILLTVKKKGNDTTENYNITQLALLALTAAGVSLAGWHGWVDAKRLITRVFLFKVSLV